MSKKTGDVLIVDDERDIRQLLSDILTDEGYSCRLASNSDEALEQITKRQPNLIILDIWMKDSRLDGLELLREMMREGIEIPTLMISGHGNIETAVESIKIGAFDFIEKPFKTEKLLILVQNAIEVGKLKQENKSLKNRAGVERELIGCSQAVEALRGQIKKLAAVNSRVLIMGPSGSGKEVVARTIHNQSQRKNHHFINANCASMHPDRLEEEFFGVEHDQKFGSLKIGILERAHQGTLFLDEVATMPLETQSKFITVLQSQKFKRLKSNRDIEVDLRIIASSSVDLQKLVEAKKFREDLFYRLNVVPLQVPSLKERKQDIPYFLDYFIAENDQYHKKRKIRFSAEAITMLQAYDWPGNIRQLKNMVEQIIIMLPEAHDGKITPEYLPPEIFGAIKNLPTVSENIELLGMPIKDARESFEKEYLKTQLERFDGNISKASEHIGMDRAALHRKLKSLGIA